jgi:menaquinone-dependent protoporphyrinogen oxidase
MIQILVAYASKHHSTEEIAETVAEILRLSPEFAVEFQAVEAVNDVRDYQVVILGSAVYAGQWQGEAVHFLKTHAGELAHKQVWLFSSGPLGEGDPRELSKGWLFPESLQPVISHIAPRDIALFHGKIDAESMTFGERMIAKLVKAPVGDFRDWEQIRRWAERIALALRSPIGQPH